jgi:hypothetical protein
MQPIQLLMWQIRRSDGRNRLGSWYHCCIQVRFPNGIQAEYDLQVPRLKFLEVEQVVQNLCLNCSDSQLNSFKARLAESLVPLNATIFAARLLKSSLLEELDDQPSSVSVTSQTTDSDVASTDSGGSTIPSVD